MARSPERDVLQSYRFWLMDVAPMELFGLPVLTPSFGFSAITMPVLTLETEDIIEGNWFYPRKVVKGGSVSSVTMSRGATFTDSDFYRWVRTALTGNTENFQSAGYNAATLLSGGVSSLGSTMNTVFDVAGAAAGVFGMPRIGGPSPRRDLVLIQYFAHGIGGGPGSEILGLTSELITSAVQGLTTTALSWTSIGNSLSTARVPARAWKLKGCIPVTYTPGTDFDATSSEVSIMELEVEVESFTELSLAAI